MAAPATRYRINGSRIVRGPLRVERDKDTKFVIVKADRYKARFPRVRIDVLGPDVSDARVRGFIIAGTGGRVAIEGPDTPAMRAMVAHVRTAKRRAAFAANHARMSAKAGKLSAIRRKDRARRRNAELLCAARDVAHLLARPITSIHVARAVARRFRVTPERVRSLLRRAFP